MVLSVHRDRTVRNQQKRPSCSSSLGFSFGFVVRCLRAPVHTNNNLPRIQGLLQASKESGVHDSYSHCGADLRGACVGSSLETTSRSSRSVRSYAKRPCQRCIFRFVSSTRPSVNNLYKSGVLADPPLFDGYQIAIGTMNLGPRATWGPEETRQRLVGAALDVKKNKSCSRYLSSVRHMGDERYPRDPPAADWTPS